MPAGDLCALDDLKQYLSMESSIGGLTTDPMLSRIISAVSAWFTGAITQTVVMRSYAETLSGDGTFSLHLLHGPVLSVQSLTVDGNTINPRDTNNDGWVLQGDWLWLSGPSGIGGALPWGPYGPYISPTRMTALRFTVGNANIAVAYTAGYQVSDEPATIPSMSPYQITTSRLFTDDVGVKFAVGGAALVKVLANPLAGQYVAAAGVYTFAAADAGQPVLLSYGCVPEDVRQATVELAAMKFRERQHVGTASQSLAGQSVSYLPAMIPRAVLDVVDRYRRYAL